MSSSEKSLQTVRLEATPISQEGRELWESLNARTAGEDLATPTGIGVIASRETVAAIVEEHGEVDPRAPIILDLEEIDIITSGSALRFIEHWPSLELVNANKDMEQCFELAREQYDAMQNDTPTVL